MPQPFACRETRNISVQVSQENSPKVVNEEIELCGYCSRRRRGRKCEVRCRPDTVGSVCIRCLDDERAKISCLIASAGFSLSHDTMFNADFNL